jgi:hypothetical protein
MMKRTLYTNTFAQSTTQTKSAHPMYTIYMHIANNILHIDAAQQIQLKKNAPVHTTDTKVKHQITPTRC